MKNFFSIRNQIFGVVAVMLSLSSCITEFAELKNLPDDLKLEISTDILFNAAAIQIMDKSTQKSLNKKVEVEIVSSDYNELYTLAGKKDLTTSNGLLLLGVRKSEAGFNDNLKMVRLRFSATGYLERDITFGLDTATSLHTVYLEPFSIQNNADIGMADYKFSLKRGDNYSYSVLNGRVNLLFDKNIDFLDEINEIIPGDGRLLIDAYTGTPKNKRYLNTLLANSMYRNLNDELVPIQFDPLLYFRFWVTNDFNKNMTSLSYPLDVQYQLDSVVFNPLENRLIQAGDYVPAFWFDPQSEAWVPTSFGVITSENGKLVAHLDVLKPGFWLLSWADVSSGINMTEECQVFIKMLGDTPDTLNGTYKVMVDGKEVMRNYSFTRKPEYRFFQIFPGCMSGSGFDLEGVVRMVNEQAGDFYKKVEPVIYQNLKFNRDLRVSLMRPPGSCDEVNANWFEVNIEATTDVDGTLEYQYGGMSGARQLNLRTGNNRIRLPIVHTQFNNWLFPTGLFNFTFLDDCNPQQISKSLALCDIPFGLAMRVAPAGGQPMQDMHLRLNPVCNSGNTEISIRPTMPILYRKSCDKDGPFLLLGRMMDGALLGRYPLKIGESYDFRVQLGTSTQTYSGIQMTTSQSVYNFDNTSVTVESVEGVIQIDFGDFVLPEGVCDLIG